MRILIVTPWFPTDESAESGIFVLRDAAALARDHEVAVLHLDWNGDAPTLSGIDSRIKVTRRRLFRRSLGSYRTARRLVREAARNADVVHTHALPGLLPFLVGRPGGRKPWIHTEHWSGLTAPETLTPAERALRIVLTPQLKRPDSVVVQCQRLARPIAKVRRRRIDMVPCIVDDPETVVSSPRDPDLLRLVGVGGLVTRKGPEVALGAVKELNDRGIAAHLTWVGDGALHDSLLAQATAAGIPDRLHLTGSLPPQGVGEQLDAADIFVLPTLGDNFCIVVAEALVHGRPVVSGSETGASDYAQSQVSEFVSEHSAIAFADAIERVRAKTHDLSADDVSATVRGAFTSQRVADDLVAIYHSLGAG